MAIDFIKIDTSSPNTAPLAPLLKSYASSMRTTYNIGKQLIGQMTHQNDGTTFTLIETLCGLPTGKGQTVFNLVNGSIGSMEGTFQVTDAKTITEQLG